MKKTIGYLISFIGLIVMAVGFGNFKVDIGILKTLKPIVITITGVLMIAIGVFLALRTDKKNNDLKAEVPIYEGKKIVGYRRG